MKTAVYLRQSLDRDQTNLAVDRQRDACLAECQRRGWTDVVEYADNDTSASSGKPRPAYADMLADIEAGAVSAVVAYHLDRLHRQPIELEHFINLADRHHVALATASGDVDLSSDQGRLVARIMGAVAKAEVERKTARQKAANKQRAERGKPWVSRSFGYTRRVDVEAAAERAARRAEAKALEQGKTSDEARAAADAAAMAVIERFNPVTDSTDNEIVEHEAAAIREGCAALLNGVSLRSIAAQWNSAGIATVNGAPWNGSTVRQVLSNCRNAGLQKYNARQAAVEARQARKDGEVVNRYKAGVLDGVETAWPAIIRRDTWEAVVSVLSDPSRHTGKTEGRVYLLSGLAHCGECGHTVGTTVRKTKRGVKQPIYSCKQPGCMKVVRNLAAVDKFVKDVVCGWLAQPDAAEVFATPSVDTKALTDQANVLRQRIAQTRLDYDDDLISARDRNAKIEKCEAQLKPIEEKLLGANTSRKLDGLLGNPKAREAFEDLTLDRQRAAIDVVGVVTIDRAGRPGEPFDPERVRVERKDAQ